MKNLLKQIFLFAWGGEMYVLIELLWRGYSHPSMFLLGGLCFLIVGLINEYLPWEMPVEIQAICGGGIITLLEFVTGLIVNIWLKLNVWDYSELPLNILGQICLPFTLVWIALSFIIILEDDWIRYRCFGEELPHYITIWRWLKRKRKRR